MFKILEAEVLAEKTYRMVVEAPNVAHSCEPGQFLIVRSEEESERIALTICDYDRERETVTIVFQTIGESSYKIAEKKAGDHFADVVGPLGNPAEYVTEPLEEVRRRHYLLVGGGLGTAPVYPQAKWLKEHGVDVDVIIGTKNKDTLIMEQEMIEAVGEEHVFVTTDDGSYKRHGMVTAVIEDLVKNEGRKYDKCVSIGPMIMMKFCVKLTKELGIPTIVSMNPIMVDGTGMCGVCRLVVGDEVKFACVDGPEFDGFKVDFDGAMKRMKLYKTEEGRRLLKYQEGDTHKGNCGGDK